MNARLWRRAAIAAAAFSPLLLAGGRAAAQEVPGAIAGRVTAAATGAPLADVQVFVVGTTRGAVTADDGRYRIDGVPPGARVLVAERIGFATATAPVDAGPAGATADFALDEEAVAVSGIVVSMSGEAA